MFLDRILYVQEKEILERVFFFVMKENFEELVIIR